MAQEQLEEGQIVLCTVNKIIGTTVFCEIEGNGEGTLTTSEIAPGRIRNLRDYVFPGKKIVCKILSIREDRINLSLRRVKQNEKKELLDKIKKEKNYEAILKTVLGKEEAKKRIDKIRLETTLSNFLESLKQNADELKEYVNEDEAKKIIKILESKKEKPKELKQLFKLSSKTSDGIKIVKNILMETCKGSKCEVTYIAAGRYNLKIQGEDFKSLKTEANQILEILEKQAKKNGCEFSIEKP